MDIELSRTRSASLLSPVGGLRLALVLAVLVPALSGAAEVVRVRGVTKPYRDETLAAVEAGRIERIHVEEGDAVTAGEAVVELDQAMQELDLERRRLIEESQAELEGARARVATLETVVEATRKLYEKTKSISREELQSKELELKLAQAEVERLDLQEKREVVERRMAEEQLRRRRVVSPIDGIVVELMRQEGETCRQHDPLLRVVDVSRGYFVAYLDPALALQLEVGDTVTLEFRAEGAAHNRPGTVSFLSPTVDSASGLQQIKVLFENPDGAVRPGEQCEMRLP